LRVFAPQGRHVAPMEVKFGMEEGTEGPLLHARVSDALGVKIWLDFLKGLWRHGGFKLRASGFPKFLAPPSGETMRQTTKRFTVERTCSRSSITMPSSVRLGFHPPPGWPRTLGFFVCLSVCLFVCLFVTLLNVRDCVPDFAMKALEYRNDFDTVG